MTTQPPLNDTALAALISSKICHDLAGQIGAINNGLELLEEENDEDTRYYAFELIQNSAKAAWAQLDFNRLAFGVSSSLGAVVPLAHVEQVARRYIENGKRKLHWETGVEELEKEYARLLLAILATALTALPAGGELHANISRGAGRGAAKLRIDIRCKGRSARIEKGLPEILAGQKADGIDGKLVVAYYAMRLAQDANCTLAVVKEGDEVIFSLGRG